MLKGMADAANVISYIKHSYAKYPKTITSSAKIALIALEKICKFDILESTLKE